MAILSNMKNGKSIKVVMLGNSGVGKTSIVNKLCYNVFSNTEKPTIGAQFTSKILHLPSGESLKFQIWDTAGQERYKSLASMYYKDSRVAIVVFDITSEDSFQGVKVWLKELKEKASDDIIKVIAANKSDLIEHQIVDMKMAMEFAEEQRASFKLVSAKESFQVEQMFIDVGRTLGLLKKPEVEVCSRTKGSTKITGTRSTQKKKLSHCSC